VERYINQSSYGKMGCYEAVSLVLLNTTVQKILTDDSAFVFVEAGHYKLNFVDCFAIVATKKAIRTISLDESIASVLEELTDDTVEVQWTC